MTQLSKVKQNIHKEKSCNLKNKKTQGPTGLYDLFLLALPILSGSTLPTVQIIFPLNLQTIAITLDVFKWRGGGHRALENMV